MTGVQHSINHIIPLEDNQIKYNKTGGGVSQ